MRNFLRYAVVASSLSMLMLNVDTGVNPLFVWSIMHVSTLSLAVTSRPRFHTGMEPTKEDAAEVRELTVVVKLRCSAAVYLLLAIAQLDV